MANLARTRRSNRNQWKGRRKQAHLKTTWRKPFMVCFVLFVDKIIAVRTSQHKINNTLKQQKTTTTNMFTHKINIINKIRFIVH